ncbi:MAG: AAA-type ATPase lid domain-containing protein, partial [Ramlibacter sp.]
ETDVRVIAASNRDPAQAVAQGKFREDLHYRLNVFPLDLPPLRDRLDDLPLLVRHFLAEMGRRENATKRATPAAMERLAQYRWPGNVRELRNVLQRAWVMSPDADITDQWLPRNPAQQVASLPASVWPPAAPARADGRIEVAVGTPLADVERQVILATLDHYAHHKERTAAALGVSLKTLYNRLKEYGL